MQKQSKPCVLLSVVADLFTIILIVRTVYLVTGPLASLIAGLSWAIAPLVLENNVYARPDPINTMLAALAIWLAANALLIKQRGSWSVWSVVAGLIATLLKYSVFPLLLPGGLAAIILTIRDPRRGFRYLAIQAGLVIITAFWLFVSYGISISNVEREGATIRDSGLANMLDLNRVANNLHMTFYALNPVMVALIVLPGLMILLWISRRDPSARSRILLAAVCVAVIVTVPWMVASFAIVTVNIRMRDVLPGTVAVAILLGIAVDQIAHVVRGRWRLVVYGALIALLTAFVYLPHLNAALKLVQQRRAPDMRVEMRQWFDANLDPGTVIVTEENEKTFNPLWGGIPYRHWLDWWETDNIMEYPVAEWREDRGMSYGVIPLSQWQTMQDSEAGQRYLAGMLRLRDFTSSAPVRGPEMIVYRLWPMTYETSVQFGDHIRLVGYDLSANTLQPGQQVDVRLYWNAPTPPVDNYSLFVHLVPADDETVLAQFDGLPAMPERLTLTWDAPSETLISPPLPLQIPDNLSSGSYRVMMGLYNFETGVRLPVQDADGGVQDDAYLLTTLQVTQ